MRRFLPSGLVAAFVLLALPACQPTAETGFVIDYEKYTLPNGLDVVLHIDRSDPIVAVAMTYHVGSAREVEGRTGFAHLFEHLLFLESENLGKGGLDILINKVGGSLNGSTSRDRTNYYQVVPSDALEKIIWAEADKMGFFINTVTESVVAKEKQVVKNEKRQVVDNRPYGHTSYVIDKHLYPEGHPYSWQIIGSLEDLGKATLQDVHDFYDAWYGPNNATLVIAGDFDVDQAKAWVEQYFGEFEARGDVSPQPIQRAQLTETKRFFHEDNFARLPAITMAWPVVEQYHEDSYALDMLGELLASGKKSPFYKVLVEEKQVTSGVTMFNRASELAGQYQLIVRAFPQTPLDSVATAIDEAFARFETEGIQASDLERIKAGQETAFYNGLSSVLGKGFQLAQYNIFADNPGFISDDIANLLAVTAEDAMRVYNQYIKGQPYVVTSFVPMGQANLALAGSVRAEVVEEPIVQGAEEDFVVQSAEGYEPTPSTFDRSVEPPFGTSPALPTPEVWTTTLPNGMKVFGIPNDETPLVQFSLRMKGGLLLDDPAKPGVANMLAQMLMAGTANRTPEELEEAIDQLGASINVSSGRQSFTISGNALARNYEATMALVSEILLEPRWDTDEFDLIRQRILSQLQQQEASPNAIAGRAFNKLMYGRDHILGANQQGTLGSVERITMEDLQAYYAAYLSPQVAAYHIAGDLTQAEALATLNDLATNWTGPTVEIPPYTLPDPIDQSTVYFVDVPDAKQSVLRVGYLALPISDPDYFRANVMNFKLGGGGFASDFMQVLREQRGYTYGISSGFTGSDIPGPFLISTSVRSNVTLESLSLIRDLIRDYPTTFDASYLEDTQNFLIRSNARRFETLGAKLGILQNMSANGWPVDYLSERETIVREMTVSDVQALANRYLNANRMRYLVVGDAATQLPRLRDLGFGDPVLIDVDGNVIRE